MAATVARLAAHMVCISIILFTETLHAQTGESSTPYMGRISAFAELGTTEIFSSPDGGGIYRSVDGGLTWTPSNTGLENWNVRDLAVHRGLLFAATEDGVFRSTDEGVTWSPASDGLMHRDLEVMFGRGHELFVITSEGSVFVSFDNGERWWPHDDMKPGAGSLTGGDLDQTGTADPVLDSADEAPSTFNLEQNYPNPFNPATSIRFDIPEEGFVTLKVYNTLGRRIATLVGRVLSPGRYTVVFDGSGFASGTYVYRLSARGFAQTRRFTLIR